MSPADINRIQSAGPAKPIVRDTGSFPLKNPASDASPKMSDAAVKVEAGTGFDAQQAPIDRSRVDSIRKALEQGTYPLNPARIADAMIAAPLLLSSGK